MTSNVDRYYDAVAEAEEKYRNIFLNLNVLAIIHDFEGNIVEANNKALETLSYSERKLLSLNVADLHPPEALKLSQKIVEQTIIHGSAEGEISLKKKNRDTFPAYVFMNLLELAGKKLIQCVVHDLTERKKIENELREGNLFFDSIIENIPDMIFLKDAKELRFVRFNKAGEELLGYSRDELLGKNDYDFFPKKEADFFTTEDEKVLKEGKLHDIPEEPIHTKAKGIRTLHTKKITIQDEHGKPKYLLGISEDITERKLLEESHRIRDRAFQAATNGILITGTEEDEYKIIHCNPAFEKMTGYSRDKIIGKNCRFLRRNDRDQEALVELRKALKKKKPYRGVLRNYKKDGTLFWNELTVSPVKDESGKFTHFIGVQHDITDRVKAEEALKKAHEELEQRVRERTAELSELNKQLKGEIEVRKKKEGYEKIISTVTQSVHQSIDLQEVMDNAVEALSNNIDNTDCVAIYMAEGDTAVLKCHRGYPDSALKKITRISKPKGFTWQTLIEGKPRYCSDVDKDTAIGPTGREAGTKSYVSMPIKYGDETIGCININSKTLNAFDEEEIKLLQIVANQIETAINNANQAEALKESEENLKEKLEQLSKKNKYEEIISAVTRSVHQSINLEDVFENAVEAMSQNIDQANIVEIYSIEDKKAVLKSQIGYKKTYITKAGSIPYPKGFIWKTAIDEKPIYCPDTEKDKVIGPAGVAAGIKTYISMPIRFEGKVFGVMGINSFQKNAFDEEEIRLLEIVATQIATAINKAQQAEALKQSEAALRKSEEHFRLLVETSNVIPWEADAKTMQFTYVGPQAQGLLGYPVEQWYEQNFWVSHLHDEDRDKAVGTCIKSTAALEDHELEYRIMSADGNIFWIYEMVSVVIEDGEPKTLRGFMIDVTERKLAEEALNSNLEQLSKKNKYEAIISTVTRSVHSSLELDEVLKNAVEAMHENIDCAENVGIFFVEGDYAVNKANRGYSKELLKKVKKIPRPKGFTWKTILEGKLLYCSDVETDSTIGPAGKKAGTKSYVSMPIKSKDKTIACISINSFQKNAFENEDLKLLEIVSHQIEIAINQSRDAEALRNSEERYRTLYQEGPSMYFTIKEDGIVLSVNHNSIEKLGYTEEELIGHSVYSVFLEEDRPKIKKQLSKCFANPGQIFRWELRKVLKDGSIISVSELARCVINASGNKEALIVCEDITERKTAEQEKREAEERYRTLIEHSYDIIVETNINGTFLYINPTFNEILGYKEGELLGRSVFEHIHKDDSPTAIAQFSQAINDFKKGTATYRFKNKSGEWRWLESVGSPFKTATGEVRTVISSRDITERMESEKKLQSAFSEIEVLKDKLEKENVYLKKEIELTYSQSDIIGQSKAIKSALNKIEQVASTDATVFLTGETGTGKELFANRVHNLSNRKDRAMIKVNCAALPQHLIESELFGHEKGAFTGAVSKSIGRFEVADDSTLFLDEVAELPLELQSKLLRVLQEGEFQRLGSSDTVKVNVRVIAASNNELLEAVKMGKFREDLFYRLNVFPVEIPSLRERKEDIPDLLWFFISEFEEKMDKSIKNISRKDMENLINYPWPGNVRQLMNVIERSMIISSGPDLKIELPGINSEKISSEIKGMEDVERDHISYILNMTNWRIRGKSGAAEVLGLKPTTLESRIKRLGIKRSH